MNPFNFKVNVKIPERRELFVTGLRERQKADRTQRILAAASRLFRDKGYDAVRIEDIAQLADVSVGTCYNYFWTKGDLLLAIVSMEVEEVILAGKSVVADPPVEVALALDSLINIYFGHSLHYLSKEMWRTAMALSIGAPETPFSSRYTELDGLLVLQVSDLLSELQRRGYACLDFDPQTMGQVVFNNLNQMFIEFVKQESMSLETLIAATSRQNSALARLIAQDPAENQR
ncbi:helix-turn-helix domain-containing protein [Defluviimonas sp. D31]|uniref:TetR/AcrR family transcriptional regulator n=1 Tax=Defluviimonas sp. D31 TaxID=3083253 RepID=UPI00296EFE72|nr:helix-turn-helix domain-containing protein [Defluviimonas sp. D31]MDW4551366.1 helix-turn-helix domain-containing protein [Defluviimonas sp. D31]